MGIACKIGIIAIITAEIMSNDLPLILDFRVNLQVFTRLITSLSITPASMVKINKVKIMKIPMDLCRDEPTINSMVNRKVDLGLEKILEFASFNLLRIKEKLNTHNDSNDSLSGYAKCKI